MHQNLIQIILLCACIFPGPCTQAQQPPGKPPLYPILENGRYGYIDELGELRIPPRFMAAGVFSEDLAAVREGGRYGYIHTDGRFAIAPVYDFAEAFQSGEALVWNNGEAQRINTKGKRTGGPSKGKEDHSKYSDDLWMHNERLQEKAEALGYDLITPVFHERRFAEINNKWYLTDAQGRRLDDVSFQQIFMLDSGPINWEEIWRDGLAFVETEAGVGAIDFDGNFVVKPRSLDFKVRYFSRYGNIIMLGKEDNESDDYNYRFGFWNWKRNLFVAPVFQEIAFEDFEHGGLIAVLQDGRSGYITPEGEYRWRQAGYSKEQTASRLNIDYMLRGSFYAASPPDERYAGYGGWGGSHNQSQKIFDHSAFEQGKIVLQVDTTTARRYAGKYEGYSLALANTGADTLVLSAQDSRLYMRLQAQDEKGEWRNVMYLPSSWCGNSYHEVFLAPGEYWSFATPAMAGGFRTRLRIELQTQRNEGAVYYSNEYEGSVNPAQFWRKRDYAPNSIMDPYDD